MARTRQNSRGGRSDDASSSSPSSPSIALSEPQVRRTPRRTRSQLGASTSSHDEAVSDDMSNMLKVPSNTGSTGANGNDYDTLSDVVMDDSRNPSRAPSRQASIVPPGPSKLMNSSMPGEDDEVDEEEQDEAEEQDEEEEADDDDAADENRDVDMEKPSPGKKMTARQQEKADEKQRKAVQRTEKKEQKREQKSNLGKHKENVKGKKASDSIKRFSYLLGQTDLFRHFIDLKKGRDPEFAALLEESEKALNSKKAGKGGKRGSSARTRKSEKQEDAELMAEAGDKEGDGEDDSFVFTESPSYVKGGIMRDYQVQGLNWMISLYHNGINGVLADEMGLGKTLQTISFLGYLKYYRDIPGPHLVVVPKSTLDNWHREFAHWVPSFRAVLLRGDKTERAEVCQSTILTQNFDVCITSYEICQLEKASLKKLSWEYIVIDEAHRIKNVNSLLSQVVRLFDSRSRLLITGTPLQNNLHELWALLNFLLPDVFSDVTDFDAWFGGQTGGKHIEEADGEDGSKPVSTSAGIAAVGDGKDDKEKDGVVQQLHKVLRPFLLRRVKADVEKSLLPKKEINVYVGMTPMQRKWYKSLLERDIDAVNGMSSKKEGSTRLLNIVMQLRKCCNHPYLFDGAEPGPPYTTDEHLVDNAGKMQVLDKLLRSMKEKGSRVLIFSQMSRVLDILEDYCMFRDYQYCRIDGQTSHEDRIQSIDEYNKPDSEKFIFLLTTRAGGLGINLTTADIVVLYDSDWNPQADLQAMDRAHRIGQKKQVYVFRFITEDAVEEKVLERAAQKLRLDQLVIQQGRTSHQSKGPGKDDLVGMIQHGAQKIISGKEDMEIRDDIDDIIKRGQAKTAELNAKYANVAFDDLHNFKSELPSTNVWEGETIKRKQQGLIWIEPTKRERKANPWANGVVRQRRPKQLRLKGQVGDWQFFPPRLLELQELEANYNKRLQGFIVPMPDTKKMSPEEAEAERAEEQAEIDSAEPLTEEEQAEKEELLKEGFSDWHKREYQGFIRGCEKYGRDNYEMTAIEIGTNKTADDVKRYSEVFWERYKEIEDWERQINKILESERQHAKNERLTQLLKDTVAKYKHPLQQLSITHPLTSRPRAYNDEEDRFLVVALARHGVGSDDVYDKIKKEILDWPMFRFDWFIKSRTPIEIGRRCLTLISLVQKEHAPEQAATDPARKGRGRKKEVNGEDAAAAGKKRENGENVENGSETGSAPPPAKKLKSGLTSRASSGAPSSRGNSAKPR